MNPHMKKSRKPSEFIPRVEAPKFMDSEAVEKAILEAWGNGP